MNGSDHGGDPLSFGLNPLEPDGVEAGVNCAVGLCDWSIPLHPPITPETARPGTGAEG